ncbi:pantetheine-phosphate adenylyltransferase [Actinomyces viscosus]|uniref:Phosphopantetheine adenylyltransferase n=1 Tax=Actinomyces viscosus TaxID=1656 RepID=A0A3S4WI67_ACTVI|nr:pantetheine-phosphate adenylyltransferase [Actinomyces viscosus]TFH53498.1 pantetheine-phosphate adenylyltransferase [Actinomyces viscosus]VEI14549.1 Phosphopantetheine adenylyltransferase [Actinomyces viscosus]
MSLAVYPGSFDPLTLGHVDIAARATTLFDVVVIGIAHNAAKAGRHLLDVEERLSLARASTSHLPGVEVDLVPGLLADYCRRRGANAVIKGLRNGSDLDAELPMALLNRDLGAPETVFLAASPAHAHISSSLVKDVAGYGRDVSALVPPAVAHALEARIAAGAPQPVPQGGAPGPVRSVPSGTPPGRFVGADHTREDLP